jgi:hypothetical protein
MARQPRRRKKKHGEPFKTAGAVLLVLLTLGAAAWGLFVWATAAPPIVRSSDTLCPTTGHTGVFVILLDATDALPEPAKNHVFTLLTEQIEALPENALLDLRVLDPKFVGGRQLAALCNPGDGRGLSEFTANPLLAQKRWRERFREPLLRELKGGLQPSPTKTSPLLATFQGIALDRFTGTRTNQRAETVHDRL